MSESFTVACGCSVTIPGTQAPLAPYVVSIGGLQGIVELNGTGVLTITTLGNTINFGLTGGAGLGTVTQVAASSSSSNLVVGGSPINTFGTLTFALAGNVGSIAGLVMAADQMVYATGPGVFVATGLTAFARTLLDDASANDARTTLGLIIGSDVQAWSDDLQKFVAAATWGSSTSLTLDADFTLAGGKSFTADGGVITSLTSETVNITDSLTVANSISGPGSGITALNASNISSGTLAVARGGTNIASYAIGDLIYASGATALSKLPDVAAGSYLRSGGVTTAPVWSTLTLPNAATTGDIFYASGANTMGRLADVATTNVLLSGGVGVAPAWGKVTTSHTTGIAASGSNSDITALNANVVTFGGNETVFDTQVDINSTLSDGALSTGNANELLTATGTGVLWSTQITIDTLTLNTSLSLEATITAAGTTGNRTINKPAGTVNMAAASGTAITVTNSLVTANSLVNAFLRSNDATARIANVVPTVGAFTINLTAAATAETSIGFIVVQPS